MTDSKSIFVTSDGKNYRLPFILITCLFLLWGFAHSLLDVLKALKVELFTEQGLDEGEEALVAGSEISLDRMVENFRRSYQELEAVRRTDIMGIYGSTHIVESEYRNSDFRMAKQLSENYGEHLHTKDLTQEPERIDTLEVNGKTYTASYFGEQDISMVKGYKTRKFWRLEDAYEDFKELPTPREILPADNYPVKIQAGQVFAVEYLMSDGSTEWKYYISDGTVQNGQLITKRMKME